MDAIIDCFTDDALYHNIPIAAVQGKAAIRETLATIMADSEAVQWDVLNIADEGRVVLTERVDKFRINGVWAETTFILAFEATSPTNSSSLRPIISGGITGHSRLGCPNATYHW